MGRHVIWLGANQYVQHSQTCMRPITICVWAQSLSRKETVGYEVLLPKPQRNCCELFVFLPGHVTQKFILRTSIQVCSLCILRFRRHVNEIGWHFGENFIWYGTHSYVSRIRYRSFLFSTSHVLVFYVKYLTSYMPRSYRNFRLHRLENIRYMYRSSWKFSELP